MVHKERFIDFIKEEWSWQRELSLAVWFKENHGCFPENYLGDDLYNDIINKFYAPFLYIIDRVEKELKQSFTFFRINVMPSHEGDSYVIVHDDEKVYLTFSCKAWRFGFRNSKEFDSFVEEQSDKIKAVLTPIMGRVS